MGIKRFFALHPRTLNTVITCVLLAASVACYPLFLILFLRPGWYNIQSLLTPNTGNIKPTVVVGLLTALFSGVTAALATRAVEHSLWRCLRPEESNSRKLTVEEARNMASWSTSGTGRLWYTISGSSWPLKFASLLLLFLSILNPVIVSGISQRQSSNQTLKFQAASGQRFKGYLDSANNAYNGGNFRDIPGTAAAIVSMSNLTAPSSSICESASCYVEALAPSIQATCTSRTLANPNDYGAIGQGVTSSQLCSTLDPKLCVTLVKSNPATFANFSGGFSPACSSASNICAGVFSIIFGAWVMRPGDVVPHDINTVECTLSYGNVTIIQNGQASPRLLRNSFIQSRYDTSQYPELVPLKRIYTDSASNSPYTFSGVKAGTGANTLYASSVGTLLLDPAMNIPANIVAARIQSAFETSTLMAFSRSPTSSDLHFTYSQDYSYYVYDAKVLLILIAPLLGTILALWGRLWVGGREVVGYDVVGIARMGPVQGVEGKSELGWDFEREEEIARMNIRCVANGEGKRLFASSAT
ncbi:hypothetical protein GLAREA_02360 [Glarea lozoyensis ATCC 20868]|uniref:Uncharacterized protein n=1 Tax=Glarea lozoyensis (strain ATCC 20868 / MF5171) TaxID=1116229 RepID=S3CIW8_GLAL2|nr:uncharacterized protein GLAREA_02360 [Glarea lozoyensis ATCC 20868]EPE26447.1 hypothetical protein GLAREA_02360 [Glarea lozoyensis ATCC 20868]